MTTPLRVEIGEVFERLTVKTFAGRDSRSGAYLYLCVCSCGNEKTVSATRLVRGDTRSCGCLRRETSRVRVGFLKHPPKHGHAFRKSASPEYRSWGAMWTRCTNPKNKRWKDYGGATPPVVICDRWLGEHGFENFFADMGPRPVGTTLGRFGDVGNYEPSNCAWQTRAEQGTERRKKMALANCKNERVRALTNSAFSLV